MITTTCETCGISFDVYPSQLKHGEGKHCSWKCRRTSVTRQCLTCGNDFLAHLFLIRDGQGKFCSQKCYGLYRRESLAGENASNWQGGKSTRHHIIRGGAEYKEWRQAVFERDNWTCQDCRKRGGNLHAHHIFPFADFSEHRFEIWNGVTLCMGCHTKLHPDVTCMAGNLNEIPHAG